MPTQINEYGPVVFMAVAVLWMAKDVLINILTKRNGSSAGTTNNGNGNGAYNGAVRQIQQQTLQALQNNTQAMTSLDASIRQQSQTLEKHTETISDLRVEVAKMRAGGR